MTRLATYLAHLQRFGIQPGLERIRALLQRLGEPQRQYPIVLVGGTNGKGSTCEFLARRLAAGGRRTGLYTSPHLYSWNERIRVLDGAALDSGGSFPGIIADDDLDQLLADAWPHLDAVAKQLGRATEFETLTALGLWHFARQNVEAAVIEVGLGGRWDATNVCDATVSVVTHVALDHCDRLGDTLEAIARDKVEIARSGRVLLTADDKPSVLDVFGPFCREHEVRFWPLRAPHASNDPTGLAQCLAALPSEDQGQTSDFQVENRRTALAAEYALGQALNWPAMNASSASLISTDVPGRAEILRRDPIVMIDGANNPDGAEHLAAVLRAQMEGSRARLFLVLGILADKDYAAMTAILAPLAHCVIATQSPSPRAAMAEIVAGEARRFCTRVEAIVPVQAALERALELAAPDDVICVTGSFYTIAEVNRDLTTDEHR